MAFGLAGCETANSLTSSLFSSSGGDAPTASVASPPPLATSRGAQFAIAPVIGPPENVSGDLRNQLMADMEKQGIRVAKTPEEKAEYTLRGYVVSSLEKKGTKSKVSYIWDVTDASGKGVHRVSGEEVRAFRQEQGSMDGGYAGARANDRVENRHLGDRLDAERRCSPSGRQ